MLYTQVHKVMMVVIIDFTLHSTRHTKSYICKTAVKPTAAAHSVAQMMDKYTKLASTHVCPFTIETVGTRHHRVIELPQEIGRCFTVGHEGNNILVAVPVHNFQRSITAAIYALFSFSILCCFEKCVIICNALHWVEDSYYWKFQYVMTAGMVSMVEVCRLMSDF